MATKTSKQYSENAGHKNLKPGTKKSTRIPQALLTRSSITTRERMFSQIVDQRSRWVRRLKDVYHAHLADLGDRGKLTEAQKALCRRVSVLQLQLELMEERWYHRDEGIAKGWQLERYQRAANNMRRICESLGLNRVQDQPVDHTPQVVTALRGANGLFEVPQ